MPLDATVCRDGHPLSTSWHSHSQAKAVCSARARGGQHICPGCGCVFFSGNLAVMVSGRLCGLCSSRADRRRAGLEGMAGNRTETAWRGKLKPTTQAAASAWGEDYARSQSAPGVPRTGLGTFNPEAVGEGPRLSKDKWRMGFVDRGLGKHAQVHHYGGTAVAAAEGRPRQAAAARTRRAQQRQEQAAAAAVYAGTRETDKQRRRQ